VSGSRHAVSIFGHGVGVVRLDGHELVADERLNLDVSDGFGDGFLDGRFEPTEKWREYVAKYVSGKRV